MQMGVYELRGLYDSVLDEQVSQRRTPCSLWGSQPDGILIQQITCKYKQLLIMGSCSDTMVDIGQLRRYDG